MMTIPVDTGRDFGLGTLAERIAARWDHTARRVLIAVAGEPVMSLGHDAAQTLAAALDYALALARSDAPAACSSGETTGPTEVRCGECGVTAGLLPDGSVPRGWFYRVTVGEHWCPSCLTARTQGMGHG
jgi:hypothetical protein